MADYIKREDIIKWIDDSLELCGDRYSVEQENMMELFRTVVNDCLPFADVVERKRGEWIRVTEELGESWMCSECMEEFIPHDGMEEFASYAHFCPNCGARMDGEDDV